MQRPQFQFSLLGLLVLFAVFGVALACVVRFGLSLAMVTILWGLLLVSLMTTPVLANVGKPQRRGFYAGFAWFGWMYILICVFGTLADSPNSTNPTSAIGIPRLVIEKWMFVTYTWVVPQESRVWASDADAYRSLAQQYDSIVVTTGGGFAGGGGLGGGGAGGFMPGGFAGGAVPTIPPANPRSIRIIYWVTYRDIGHAILATLWALLGGCFVLLVAWWNARHPSAASSRRE